MPVAGPWLFPERSRTDPSPAGDEEPSWAFLDRVNDPVFDRVRRLMNAWFAEYPPGENEDLRRRLASSDRVEFRAAWLELYLHALHRRLGFEVIPHPELPGVSTRPDFRLIRGGSSLLLEATSIGNRADAARERRIDRITAAINRTRCADFYLLFEIEQEGTSSPPMRDVRRRLERWIADLDWESLRAAVEAGCAPQVLPLHVEVVGDWTFSFQAWPRKPELRGVEGPAIGAGPSGGGVWDHAGTLLDRLEQKAGKYGAPGEPMIIAVRMDHMGVREDDIESALLGPTIGRADPARPGNYVDTGRRGKGFFRSASGDPRNRHVTGVLFLDEQLMPWSITKFAPVLWLHPDPLHALAIDPMPWASVDLCGDSPNVVEGAADVTTIFDLPNSEAFDEPRDWPGTPFRSAG